MIYSKSILCTVGIYMIYSRVYYVLLVYIYDILKSILCTDDILKSILCTVGIYMIYILKSILCTVGIYMIYSRVYYVLLVYIWYTLETALT